MAIVFRTAGPWGPGSAGDLDPAVVDNNFYEVVTRIELLETTPPTPISIDHFIIEGTLLTIVLTNGVEHGPFVLPIAQWRWTGAWLPLVQYFVGDIVEENGNIYFIRVQHVSDTEFDPGLFTAEGQVYVLILSKAVQPYDVGMYYNDLIGSGAALLMLHVVVRDLTIPVNFTGSQAFLYQATTTSPITLPVYKNDVVIGTISFSPGVLLSGSGQYGAFVSIDSVDAVELAATDLLSIGQPYEEDATASHLAVTIACGTPSL